MGGGGKGHLIISMKNDQDQGYTLFIETPLHLHIESLVQKRGS